MSRSTGRVQGRGRGRGGIVAAATAADSTRNASSSAVASIPHVRGHNWSNDEIVRLLQALLDYATKEGLPASTKVPGQEHSNAEEIVPVGWSVISDAMYDADPAEHKLERRLPIQVMRKYDNLKTEAKDLFKWIAAHWEPVLRQLAEVTYPDDPEEGYRQYHQSYRVNTSFPFGFQYEFPDLVEPEQQVIDAVKKIINESPDFDTRLANKAIFILEEVIWYFDEINSVAAIRLPALPSARRSRQQQRREHFQLNHADRDMMMEETASQESSSSTSSTSNERRRRPRNNDDELAKAIQAFATSTQHLADSLNRFTEHKDQM